MFLLVIYLIAVVSWGWIFFDLIVATYLSIKNTIDTPRLLIPLAIASLSLFLESGYGLVANIYRYMLNDVTVYLFFLQQENVSIIKLFIAISGVFMLMKLRAEKNQYRKRKG